MAFKVRDLLISTIPRIGAGRSSLEDLLRTGHCDAGSEVPPGPPPPPPGPDSPIIDAPDLVELRALLQVALIRLGGPVTEAELQPQTVEDLDQLESRLTSALEEVRDLKTSYGVR